MARTKEILTALGTLGCAVGIGFVMQSSESAAKRYGNAPVKTILPAAKDVKGSSSLLNVEAITLTAAEFEPNVDLAVDLPVEDTQVVTTAAPQSILPEPDLPAAIITPVCELTAHARPVAAAMVNVTLDAACLPNERVTIHHDGLIFTQMTSATGQVDITMPALSEDAVFIMAFSNGDGAVAQTIVEDISDFNRVAVQWKGQTGFEIHAREFGASYGEDGHVWKGAPGEIADAITGDGGFITRLGDPLVTDPLMAEVYSFPNVAVQRAGEVVLSVETEVSPSNCGLEIEAQALEIAQGGDVKTRNLTLSVPQCEAIGDFLVLNSLLPDMKVAVN